MASKGNEKEKVQVVVPKTAADVQRLKLDKLMKNAAEVSYYSYVDFILTRP